jgi:hypothetical protein
MMSAIRMSKIPLVLLLGLLGGLLGGCGELLQPGYRYARVEVLVITPDAEPLQGVDLILYTGQRPMGYGSTDLERQARL